MTQQEIVMCRRAAQLYQQVKRENTELRLALEDKRRTDRKMDAEDAEVMAMVNGNRQPIPLVETVHRPIFDFDNAEIDEIEGELVECQEPSHIDWPMVLRNNARFIMFVVIECVLWLCHHFGWMDLVSTIIISLIIYLLANLRLI